MKIIYVGLEPYEGRYTLQLRDWTEKEFKRLGVDYEIIEGSTIDNSKQIHTGQVLDAHGRCFYALEQTKNIVQKLKDGEIDENCALFFEDMFHPGIESLPYIFYQMPKHKRPEVWLRCLAQSIDPDDFVHVTDMQNWMSKYEQICCEFATGILASNEEMVANMKIANWDCDIYNISGLSFSASEVRSRVKEIPAWEDKYKRVVFAARLDQEKQPWFYLDLIDNVLEQDPSIEFCVLAGGEIRSNHTPSLERLKQYHEQGKLKVYNNLKKNEYYKLLAESRVMFNCALQDWTSNTVSEADALECNVVYPAYRSFPEIFANDHSRLYVPWSIEDATNKLIKNLEQPNENIGKISNWTSETISRMVDIINGYGEDSKRNNKTYRNKVSENKYL